MTHCGVSFLIKKLFFEFDIKIIYSLEFMLKKIFLDFL